MSTKEAAEKTGEVSEVKLLIKLPPKVEHPSSKKAQGKDNELSLLFNREAKVQSILDVLGAVHSAKFFTNVELESNGRTLIATETLSDVIGDDQAKTFKVQLLQRPYNAREVLRHLLTTREYLGFTSETTDGLSDFAVSTGSKFQELPLEKIKPKIEAKEEENRDEKGQGDEPDGPQISPEEKEAFGKVVREIFEELSSPPNMDVYSTGNNIITPCLRSLCLSHYNPVPAFYQSQGHIMYLKVVTLEGETFFITAVPSGFYVNKSTESKFDPSPKELENGEGFTRHSLHQLIGLHSKKFFAHIDNFEKRVSKLDSAVYVKPTTAFLHKPWLISSLPTEMGDYLRLQTNCYSFDTERNFNDEFQAVRELVSESLQERVEAERLLTRIGHEFSVAAAKAAMSIFHGDLVAMNPESPKEEQIYLKDNIFYSFVTDVSGNFAGKGGDEAAYAASNQDLRVTNLLNRLNLREVRYLLATVIDFAGKRVLAQTPVPGLLSTMGTTVVKDPETGNEVIEDLPNEVVVNYGFDEAEGKIVSNPDFDECVQKEFSKTFHLKTHEIDGTKISFSSQSKGIIGFDKRKYILDLANTYPLDIQFVKSHYDGVDNDKRYPHRQTLLRPELIEKWWQTKLAEAGVEYKEAYEKNMFAYNPDAYQIPGVEDPVVDELSDFLNNTVLPSVVEDYASTNAMAPYDGSHIVDNLHINGVNVRYLGKLVELAKKTLAEQTSKYEENLLKIQEGNKEHQEWEKSYLAKIETMLKERQKEINKYIEEQKEIPKELTENLKLDDEEIRKPTKESPAVVAKDYLLPLIFVGELEIISRALKHVLRKYSRPLPVPLVPSLVAYVFNLLFGMEYNDKPIPEEMNDFYPVKNYQFSKLTRASLLKDIEEQAFLRFRYVLPADWFEQHSKVPLFFIRSVSYGFGIQLINKSYFFSKEQFSVYQQNLDKKIRNKVVAPVHTFSASDLLVIPLVKTTVYGSSVGDELWAEGAAVLEKDQKLALTFLTQAIAVKEDVSTILDRSVAEKYLALSTIYSSIGLVPEAVAFARKASIIYERVSGLDSFELLRSLSNLALLEYTNRSPYNAALVYKRIIAIVKLFDLTNKHHPVVVSALNYLEELAMNIKDSKLAIEILKKLCALVNQLDGEQSLANGYLESRIGNLYATIDDMKHSLDHISRTKDIFTKELGINHEVTAQARQWTEGLTNLIKNNELKKKTSEEQAKVNGNASQNHKVVDNKKVQPNPVLANKSVDELLSFIEGPSEQAVKHSKNKKKSKGKNSKK
ncbi:related to Clustered mitochondria protein 1 [Zygosaccharomyces bailii]|nr:related to Clustered mitochondria protein 1 [Zygosaccharomyces bailii]